MPLALLWFAGTPVSDVSPLRGMNLSSVSFTPKNITKGLDVIRQMKSIRTMGTRQSESFAPAEFWKKYDAGEFGQPDRPAKLAYLDPAFEQWVKSTQALPAEKQIEAVSKKLMELNPGFDGEMSGLFGKSTPLIASGVVTELAFATDYVTDISPVRALAGLRSLDCSRSKSGKTLFDHLSPLQGMHLEMLICTSTEVSDLAPLRGMRLKQLRCGSTKVSDLTPLEGMPLTTLIAYNTNISSLLSLKGAL